MFRGMLLKTDMGSKRLSVPYHPKRLGNGGSVVAIYFLGKSKVKQFGSFSRVFVAKVELKTVETLFNSNLSSNLPAGFA